MLWFDVEKNGYTTIPRYIKSTLALWFDVEKNGYTTQSVQMRFVWKLWFDVEKNGYTTIKPVKHSIVSCGLM